MVSFDDLIPQQKRPSALDVAGNIASKISNLTPASMIAKAIAESPRTALEQGLQGATFNLADEATDVLGAGIASAATGENFSDLYQEARGMSKERLKKQMETRPALSIGANIGGALLTGGASAATKGGKAITDSIRASGLAMRTGKAGLLGAASGAAAGFGAGSGGENRLESASNSALVGGLAGGAIPVVGTVAGKLGNRAPSPLTAEQIKEKANQAYQLADQRGGILKGWFTNRFLDSIKDIQPPTVAGKRVPTDPKLDQALEYVNSFKNTRLTLQDAQNLDEYLGDAIDGFTELGSVNKSGQKLLEVQRRLRDSIESADESLIEGGKGGFEALKEARQLWAAQLRMRDVERIIQRAEMTDNPASAIKTGFKNLLTNAKKSRGFSTEELKAIEQAAKGGPVQDTLRTFGSRLWTIAGGAAGGPLGAVASQAGSMASRGLATRNALTRADDVARAVSSRVSPGTQIAMPSQITQRTTPLAVGGGNIAGGQADMPAQPMPQTPMPATATPIAFDDLIPQAQNSGPDSSLMGRIAQAESSGNPNAQNPNSSASGLYQFTDSTWRSAVDKWGRRYGIKYSDKNNPEAQAQMMQFLTQDNARILQNKGIEPSDANLYFAHFLGAPAASKAISMLGKNAIAARSFPTAAASNREVFYDGARPRTIDEVYQLITSKVV